MKRESLWRVWLYLLAQVLLGAIGLAYVALAVIVIALLVLVIGLPLALGVVALGRGLASISVALIRWLWRIGPQLTLAPLPREGNLATRAGAALVAPSTRRIIACHAFNAICLPVTLVAWILFPCALLWGPAHPRIMVRILGPALATMPTGDGEGTMGVGYLVQESLGQQGPFQFGSGQTRLGQRNVGPSNVGKSGGHGLVGMHERVTALGGDLRVGPTGDGGFEVSARLPLPPA